MVRLAPAIRATLLGCARELRIRDYFIGKIASGQRVAVAHGKVGVAKIRTRPSWVLMANCLPSGDQAPA